MFCVGAISIRTIESWMLLLHFLFLSKKECIVIVFHLCRRMHASKHRLHPSIGERAHTKRPRFFLEGQPPKTLNTSCAYRRNGTRLSSQIVVHHVGNSTWPCVSTSLFIPCRYECVVVAHMTPHIPLILDSSSKSSGFGRQHLAASEELRDVDKTQTLWSLQHLLENKELQSSIDSHLLCYYLSSTRSVLVLSSSLRIPPRST